ncbi:tail fiber assembly protein [Enterobacter ludwigii]|uniref:tail fiber assembly protein n=1 Tax=Enterobacter ludwigii TaxID=299767 RepID=UPI002A7FACF3|nr:tail fiber assembly protein [Enterobacter ludwigii]
MSETYYYSAKNNGFYADSMMDDYKNADAWPDDAIKISEGLYRKLMEGQSAGKVIVATKTGRPSLAEPPAPTEAELISQAESVKTELLATASAAIAPLQDAEELEIATAEESEALKSWKKYRVMLNRVDTSKAPDIEWPEIPSNVA